MVIESDRSAVEYGSLVLEDGAPVKQDMAVDRTGDYLYAMTDTRVNNRHLINVYRRRRHHRPNICSSPVTREESGRAKIRPTPAAYYESNVKTATESRLS